MFNLTFTYIDAITTLVLSIFAVKIAGAFNHIMHSMRGTVRGGLWYDLHQPSRNPTHAFVGTAHSTSLAPHGKLATGAGIAAAGVAAGFVASGADDDDDVIGFDNNRLNFHNYSNLFEPFEMIPKSMFDDD